MLGNASDAFKIFAKSIRLGILFEVVDDPEDHSDFFNHLKPIDVWLFASKTALSLENSSLPLIQANGVCLRNITKATPAELRTYAITTFEDGFLYVWAVPTKEWSSAYSARQYGAMPVKTGRSYNFGVSLPSKSSTKGLGKLTNWKGN